MYMTGGKSMKKWLACMLAAAALCSVLPVYAAGGLISPAPTASAARPTAGGAADALYALGLVGGYGKNADGSVNFALGEKLTRAQAFVLVVRFVGAEKDATLSVQSHPFTDVPAWANPYIGYVYANGITKGVSETKFDPDTEVSEAAFLTIMLRVLGYNDGAGDFRWDDPYTLAQSVGIADAKADTFNRGSAFVICYRALTATVKSGNSIAEQLIAKGVFTKEAYDKAMNPGDDTPIVIPGESTLKTVITPIAELNTKGEDGDHADDDFNTASVEADFRTKTELTVAKTGQTRYQNAWYPRVKKVRDDLYLLLYHYGELGLHMYYATSRDGVNWNTPQVLYRGQDHMFTYTEPAKNGDTSLVGKTQNYAAVNPDAVVLQNGEILCVFAERAPSGYRIYADLCGLFLLRGKVTASGGIQWSKPTKIYTGQVWEPGIQQRSDGTVEVYFTQIAPYIDLYGFDAEKRSAGVGLIVSGDNGYSWTPNIQAGDTNHYRATTVVQTALGNKVGPDGVSHPYFGGQMPVPVELYNGKTLLVYEIQDLNLKFWGSYATSGENGVWRALDLEEVGPDTLSETVYSVGSPYVTRFKSGETYMVYNKGARLYGRLGKPDGTAFANKDFQTMEAVGIWGSVSPVGSHAVIAANQHKTADGNSGLMLVREYLNHRINAPKTAVTADGYTNDWDDIENTDALFVGSASQAQMTLRAAHDDENVYFLLSRSDYFLQDGDTMTVCIAAGAAADYRVTVGVDGIRSIEYFANGVKQQRLTGGKAAVKVLGTVGNNDDRDEGYVAEIAIPKALVGLTGAKCFKVRPALVNADGSGPIGDTLTGVSAFSTALWPEIILD